ncbi:CCA-adding enzyme [compost metagenome]
MASDESTEAQLALMERADALRKPDRFFDLLKTASILRPVDMAVWQSRVDAVRGVDAGAIAKACAGDPARIKDSVRRARLDRLRAG